VISIPFSSGGNALLGRCRGGLGKQAALRDQPQGSKRDKADCDIRAGTGIRRKMCDRAGVAVADHSDRRDGGSDDLLRRGLVPSAWRLI